MLNELIQLIDSKLNDSEYEICIPKINNNLNTILFENLGYIVNLLSKESVTEKPMAKAVIIVS